METRICRIRFLTPAFLGNAEQNGQWRTPPFKALLRQWWRVAWAKKNAYSNDIGALRAAEGRLFGTAAGDAGNRSLVRLRLDCWDMGKLKSWDKLEQPPVDHKEVQKTGYKVGPHAYLGFGPLDGRSGTKLAKPNAAIQDGESARLRLACPADQAPLLDAALALMARYGTLGGRSRNGWGSFELVSEDSAVEHDNPPTRDWRDCLDRDWPHALGRDNEGVLIWRTEAFEDWKALMRRLAEIKIGLRTQFVFPHAKPPHQQVQPRHWLSYPITTHRTKAWPGGARLPNSLRFKVRADGDRLRGVIFHVPCKPPAQFGPDQHLRQIEYVWQQVHGYLDNAGLERIPA